MKAKSVVAWGLTLLLAVTAAGLGYRVYLRHMTYPWTRDGLVNADLVLVAPRVSGPVRSVNIVNNQVVKAGDLLFSIDPAPYELAVTEAEAMLAEAVAQEAEKAGLARRAEGARRINIQAVSDENMQQATDALNAATASRKRAEAVLDNARLNLQYTDVNASVDGYVTNVSLRPGTMAVAANPLFALIDASSFRVTGFFRETLVSHVPVGGRAEVTLMAYPDMPLEGEVQSIDWGISRNDGSAGRDLLPAVSPTFDWVRLAQRVPVNIKIKNLPTGVQLRVGLTASVLVTGGQTGKS